MPFNVADMLGACSWSLKPDSPTDLVDKLQQVGLRKVQLALRSHGDQNWSDAKKQMAEAGIEIVSGMFGCVGEDYSTLETIRKTGGVVPDDTWPRTWEVVQAVAPTAVELEVPLVSFHAGFLPDDPSDERYQRLLDRTGRIADLFGKHGIDIAFETGQETAPALKGFLENLNRPNVGVNFDPANMILYAKGDPVESLRTIAPHLSQCHIKDAKHTTEPGTWGAETPVGDGDVDWVGFLQVIRDIDFNGALVIEREGGDRRIEEVIKAKNVILENAERMG